MNEGLRAFAQLKTEVLDRYRQAYPHFQGTLADFRQADILNFQNMLEQQLHDRVSEKWFYTHLKVAHNEKLPRIDTLDLLARFVGYASWEAFRFAQEQRPKSARNTWIWGLGLIGLLLVLAAFSWWPRSQNVVTLCFYDALRQQAITEVPVSVNLWMNGEMIQQRQTETGQSCIVLNSVDQDISELIFTAPYYFPDTLAMASLGRTDKRDVYLQADDYALMIHYFSNSKVEDWKKRREQLEQIFADDAIIYQVDPAGRYGMDILNKTEFINRMTIPINTLKGVEVLQTTYLDGKIIELRFTVKEQ